MCLLISRRPNGMVECKNGNMARVQVGGEGHFFVSSAAHSAVGPIDP